MDLNESIQSCYTQFDQSMDYEDPKSTMLKLFSPDQQTLRSYLDDSYCDSYNNILPTNDPLMGISSRDSVKRSDEQKTPSTENNLTLGWADIFSNSLCMDNFDHLETSSVTSFSDLIPFDFGSITNDEYCDKIVNGQGNDYYDLQTSILETNQRKEYKKILSLNIDNSQFEEPWNGNVGKKILTTYYTPLNLKSEFWSNKIRLDEFESFILEEALNAFPNKETIPIYNELRPDPRPAEFVRICAKVRAYRKLNTEDKMTLLNNVFFDMNAMKSIITYDQSTDCFNYSGKRLERMRIYKANPDYHDRLIHTIETFPDRWRNDIKAIALIYLILIFNPDLPNLKYVDAVRMEQYGYIYLLGRYLRSVCEANCDASENLYRLMVKILEIQRLRKNIIDTFEALKAGSSLNVQNVISKMIQRENDNLYRIN